MRAPSCHQERQHRMRNLSVDAFLTALSAGVEPLRAVHAHGSRVIALARVARGHVGVSRPLLGTWHASQVMRTILMPRKAVLHSLYSFNILVLQSLWSASILWLKALDRPRLVAQSIEACLWLGKKNIGAFARTLEVSLGALHTNGFIRCAKFKRFMCRTAAGPQEHRPNSLKHSAHNGIRCCKASSCRPSSCAAYQDCTCNFCRWWSLLQQCCHSGTGCIRWRSPRSSP